MQSPDIILSIGFIGSGCIAMWSVCIFQCFPPTVMAEPKEQRVFFWGKTVTEAVFLFQNNLQGGCHEQNRITSGFHALEIVTRLLKTKLDQGDRRTIERMTVS